MKKKAFKSILGLLVASKPYCNWADKVLQLILGNVTSSKQGRGD